MCLSLGLAGFNLCAGADSPAWKQYADPLHHFLIHYPDTTKAETMQSQEPGLLSRVVFEFEQAFDSGADVGSLKFRFQISVWQNTNHLTAEAWAKQNLKPQFTLETRPIQIAGRKGVLVKTTNLVWPTVKIFVVDQDCLYELSHMDIAANKLLLSDDTRSRWVAAFGRMVESFRILSQDGGSK